MDRPAAMRGARLSIWITFHRQNCSFSGSATIGRETDGPALIRRCSRSNGYQSHPRRNEEGNRFTISLVDGKSGHDRCAYLCFRGASNSDEGFAESLGGSRRDIVIPCVRCGPRNGPRSQAGMATIEGLKRKPRYVAGCGRSLWMSASNPVTQISPLHAGGGRHSPQGDELASTWRAGTPPH